MKRGDIHWIHVPSTQDHVQSGTRPHVIVQNDFCTSHLSTLLVVPLTSNLNSQRYPATVLVPCSDLNGLTSDSVALAFQVFTVDKRRLRGWIGDLEPHLMDRIQSSIHQAIEP